VQIKGSKYTIFGTHHLKIWSARYSQYLHQLSNMSDGVTFRNMKVKLNIFNAFQHPPDTSEWFFLDILEESMEDSLPFLLTKDPLEVCLTHFSMEDFDTEQYSGHVQFLLNTGGNYIFPS